MLCHFLQCYHCLLFFRGLDLVSVAGNLERLKKVRHHIKALVLRRDSDWRGDAFGDASAAFRQAAAAPAIEEPQ